MNGVYTCACVHIQATSRVGFASREAEQRSQARQVQAPELRERIEAIVAQSDAAEAR